MLLKQLLSLLGRRYFLTLVGDLSLAIDELEDGIVVGLPGFFASQNRESLVGALQTNFAVRS